MRCIKHLFLLLALAAGMVSCRKAGQDAPDAGKPFYATIDNDLDTKVYADEDLHVRWDADDRISIFDRYTLNEQYRFTGETGANAGWFDPVPRGGFRTGNKLDYVYAVYPYRAGTSIGDDGVLKVKLAKEQPYRADSFGPGAHTMVSVTKDDRLLFRNACGYLVLKLYGEGIEVSSITLKGSFGEPLAGEALVSMLPGEEPSLKMADAASSMVELVCGKPVVLPAKPEEAVSFWFALPPMEFEHGFTAEVKDSDGRTYYPYTKKAVKVPRNRKVSMAPFELRGNAPGQVTIDKKPVCDLLYVKGENAEGNQHWEFSGRDGIRVLVDSWRCRCITLDHIGYHVSLVELDIPDCPQSIPLERTTGDDYISSNKSVAGAHLNRYSITEDGKHLDFDLSITLNSETKGDIRIVYSGPIL